MQIGSSIAAITVTLVAFSCAPNNAAPQVKTNANGHRTDKFKQSNKQLNLTPPTLEQLTGLEIVFTANQLGRVVAIADTYKIGYHHSNELEQDAHKLQDAAFFNDFWQGHYDSIDEHLANYSVLLQSSPENPVLLARLGFLRVWRFAERYRQLDADTPNFSAEAYGTLQADIGACVEFFSQALNHAPENAVYRGFAADCALLAGGLSQDNNLLLQGLSNATLSTQQNPEFNLFTIGYALGSLNHETKEFQLGLEMMWRNLEVCFETTLDRDNPDISAYLKTFNPLGNNRYCSNSEIAPHNFEGFFLVFGDLLLKAGRPELATKAYANAKLLPSYQTWPHQNRLQERIANASDLVLAFQQPVNPAQLPDQAIIFHSEAACMVCHQAR